MLNHIKESILLNHIKESILLNHMKESILLNHIKESILLNHIKEFGNYRLLIGVTADKLIFSLDVHTYTNMCMSICSQKELPKWQETKSLFYNVVFTLLADLLWF